MESENIYGAGRANEIDVVSLGLVLIWSRPESLTTSKYSARKFLDPHPSNHLHNSAFPTESCVCEMPFIRHLDVGRQTNQASRIYYSRITDLKE